MTEHYDGAFEIERAWREGLTPDPILTVSEWSDQHRVLSSMAASEPGRWRTRRTPYLRDIMDCLSPTSAVERVVFMKGAQIGAPLDIETPIPTPSGWKRMADIEPGDQVFDERGHSSWVIGVSPVFTGRSCFEVVFSDRTQIVCDAGHLWTVTDERNYRRVKQRTLTTRDIAETFVGRGKKHRYAIDLTQPLSLPEQALPLHPYLLGMWLGNGNRGMNRISVHEEDGPEIAAQLQAAGVHAEFVLPAYRKGRTGEIVIDPGVGKAERCPKSGRMIPSSGRANFTRTLIALGLHKNKFIPPIYLRASINQRFELLRGLMDSDGSVTVRGRCEFTTVLPTLWVGVQDLMFGLGLKPTVYPFAATTRVIRGRAVDTQHGWRLSFTSYMSSPVRW